MSASTATVLLTLLVFAIAFVLHLARRRLRGGGAGAADVAAAQRNYLASNWSEVEAAAVRGGMDAEQIAEVRRKLLGA